MFCENCGNKLPEESKFCPSCGASITHVNVDSSSEKLLDTEIQLSVRPSYKFGYMLLPELIVCGIFSLMMGLIFGIADLRMGIVAFLINFVILFTTVILKAIITKKQYNNFCYDFYKTKVVYKDKFLNLSEKEVKYKYIREITMRQTFVQRYFNLGDIILFTNAENSYGNGIRIINVENVEDIYKNIKSIINI